MSTQPGGPPNKWSAFSTKGMTDPSEYAQALSDLSAQGYTGPVTTVPSPVYGEQAVNVTWVAVGGYTGTGEDEK